MTAPTTNGVVPKAPALCSERWNLSIVCFFGTLIIYVVRVNLSVAIICMVRAPPISITSGLDSNQSALGERGLISETNTVFPDVTSVQSVNTSDKNQSYENMDNYDVPEGDCSLEIMNAPQSSYSTRCIISYNDEAVRASVAEDQPRSDVMSDLGVIVSMAGEFDWDKRTQSRLLSMYFYGYIFTQIPGGWLAGRYGGRRVWGVCQAVCALCTLVTPLAARANVYLVDVCRFILGLAAGVTFPCVYSTMGRWAPKLERSKLVALSLTGQPVGNVLTFSLSALLCVYGFDNGWGSIFYLAGIGNLLWVVVWFVVTADTPAEHKRISEAERNYIQSSLGETASKQEKLSTPWRAIFTSKPVWACLFAHILSNYTNYTLLTSLPTFMKEVLRFDIKQVKTWFSVGENGSLSALPFLCQALICVLTGQVADRLRERGVLSTKNTRKLFQVTAFLGSAVCILGAGYMTCAQRPLAVLLLCLCLSFVGLNRAGYAVNAIDIAPRHAGVLVGISNTAATLPGMIAPLVTGALTPNSNAEEWRHVFFLCAGMATLGAILFGLLAEGELQSWATPVPVQLAVERHKLKGEECHENPAQGLPKTTVPDGLNHTKTTAA